MKLLTAFVRTSRIDEVIQALHEAGAPGITVIVGVHAVDYDYLPIEFSWTPGELGRAPEVLEVQVVCREKDCDRLLDVLVEAAQTGLKGDGLAFVSDVARAVRIRTREEGPEVVRNRAEIRGGTE
jgi:nitrogen regulatory protein PII